MPYESMQALIDSFNDPETARQYSEGPHRMVPGFASLHRMTAIVLADRAPKNAQILALGAGGGLELPALAKEKPDWTFVGVDPAAAMLDVARQELGLDAARVSFCEGFIDDAPAGPFDGAVCLLTLHYFDTQERIRTVREIHKRLKPGAPFVAVHISFPQEGEMRSWWVSRYVDFAIASGVDAEQVEQMRQSVYSEAPFLTPEQDEAVLREAGFSAVTLFYAALPWRGWVAYA